MDTVTRFTRAAAGFDRIVAAMPTGRWDDPSACPGWTARDVLGHVVWSQRMVASVAADRPPASFEGGPGSPAPRVLVPGDPLATWRVAHSEAVADLTPRVLARTVTLRAFGEVPVATLLDAQTTDLLAHTWDIAHPAGLDDRLDDELVGGCLAWSRAHEIRAPGGIGPEITVPGDADEQTRLLAFLGRSATAEVR